MNKLGISLIFLSFIIFIAGFITFDGYNPRHGFIQNVRDMEFTIYIEKQIEEKQNTVFDDFVDDQGYDLYRLPFVGVFVIDLFIFFSGLYVLLTRKK